MASEEGFFAPLRMTVQSTTKEKSRSHDFVTAPLTGARFTSLGMTILSGARQKL
jgi:hypothetical protein